MVGGRLKGEGTYVHPRLIHADVWQKPTQHCKTNILQLKINWDFPGGPVVKKSTFPCRGHGFNSWLGDSDSASRRATEPVCHN